MFTSVVLTYTKPTSFDLFSCLRFLEFVYVVLFEEHFDSQRGKKTLMCKKTPTTLKQAILNSDCLGIQISLVGIMQMIA